MNCMEKFKIIAVMFDSLPPPLYPENIINSAIEVSDLGTQPSVAFCYKPTKTLGHKKGGKCCNCQKFLTK